MFCRAWLHYTLIDFKKCFGKLLNCILILALLAYISRSCPNHTTKVKVCHIHLEKTVDV